MADERIVITEIGAEHFSTLQDLVRYEFVSKFVMGSRVLDIACGSGYGSYILSQKAASVVGCDVSTDALGYFNWKAPQLFFFLADATRVPFRNSSFDVVISLETIEHVGDPDSYLRELNRVLTPGGKLIISTPRNETQSRFTPENPFHLREYSAKEFSNLLSAHFSKFDLFSQETAMKDDAIFNAGRALESRITPLQRMRHLMPESFRRLVRRLLGSEGRRPAGSRIVEGVTADAHVQIAVISRA